MIYDPKVWFVELENSEKKKSIGNNIFMMSRDVQVEMTSSW